MGLIKGFLLGLLVPIALACPVQPVSNSTAIPTNSPTTKPITTPSANPPANPSASSPANPSANPPTNPSASPPANPITSASTNPPASPTTSPTSSPTTNSTSHASAPGCPAGFKNVVFNGGYSPSQFSLIPGASNYITFGLGNNPGQLPMMAFASDVANAVSLVNSANPPEYMLTFNEPDYSYMGLTPTMTPQQAASAIQPLLASPGTKTKFIAPVTADPTSTWLSDFYAACGCQNFFHAYNIHVYIPNLAQAESDITTFHNKFADKPLWITEIAPGNANPACSLDWPTVESFMSGLYSWGASTGWIEKIFWNTGNEIPNDTNVCNSYLLGANNQPSPLLAAFTAVNCS